MLLPPGHLGLPLIYRNYDIIASHYNYLISNVQICDHFLSKSTYGSELLKRLENDPRVKMLHSKKLCTGNDSDVFCIRKLAMWWIWRANHKGIEIANRELEIYLDSSEVDITGMMWVHGIEPTQKISLPFGIELIPLKEVDDCLEIELYNKTLGSPIPQLRNTVPFAALKVNYKVEKTIEDMPSDNETVSSASGRFYETSLLLNCLSNICCIDGYRTSYLAPNTPPGFFCGSAGGHEIKDIYPKVSRKADNIDSEFFEQLICSYKKLSEADQKSIKRGLLRLAQSKATEDPHDRILDLALSLEIVLLRDVTHRFRKKFISRTTALIAADINKKLPENLRKIFEDLYNFRCDVAHQGYSNKLENMNSNQRDEMFADYENLAENIFCYLISNGIPKNWDNI